MDIIRNNLFSALDNIPEKVLENFLNGLTKHEDAVLSTVERRGYAYLGEMETINEIYESLDHHIKFISEYNEDVSYYL